MRIYKINFDICHEDYIVAKNVDEAVKKWVKYRNKNYYGDPRDFEKDIRYVEIISTDAIT